QTPGDRDDGSTYPAPLSHPYAPGPQPRRFPALDKQCMCGLVEHRAQQGVATFGHPAFSIATNVKPRPDHLITAVLRFGSPVTRGSRFSSRSASGRLMMG